MDNSSPSKDQWREFHYGKPSKRKPKTHWALVYGKVKLVEGAYSLCKWKMNEVLSNGRVPTKDKHLLKII